MTILSGSEGVIGRHFGPNYSSFSYRKYLSGEAQLPGVASGETKLIHLAGVVGDRNIRSNLEASHKANVDGVLLLAHEFASQGGKVFFFASSSHVYGATGVEGATEAQNTNPKSLYAEQKLLAEDGLRDIATETGMKVVLLRIFSVLGGGMPDFSLWGAIQRGIEGSSRISNSSDVRDFLSPMQVANVICQISKRSTLGPEELVEVINVCSGSPLTIREASLKIAAIEGAKLEPSAFSETQGMPSILVGNPSKMLSLLALNSTSWKPYASGQI